MNINIELHEDDLKKLVIDHLIERLGPLQLKPEDVKIETKSAQNFKSEWETAQFRATIVKRA